MGRGTVSMRVASVLRSAEVQPLFRRFVWGLKKMKCMYLSTLPLSFSLPSLPFLHPHTYTHNPFVNKQTNNNSLYQSPPLWDMLMHKHTYIYVHAAAISPCIWPQSEYSPTYLYTSILYIIHTKPKQATPRHTTGQEWLFLCWHTFSGSLSQVHSKYTPDLSLKCSQHTIVS